jgi:hypothetical protein
MYYEIYNNKILYYIKLFIIIIKNNKSINEGGFIDSTSRFNYINNLRGY